MASFGNRLRSLRASDGLTQSALAGRLGYAAHVHVSNVEKGQRPPTLDFALRLLRAGLGSSPASVLAHALEDTGGTAFADRPPSASELEVLRLLLSTYQDGSGFFGRGEQEGPTEPGNDDLAEAVRVAFGGQRPRGIDFAVFRDDSVVLFEAKAGTSSEERAVSFWFDDDDGGPPFGLYPLAHAPEALRGALARHGIDRLEPSMDLRSLGPLSIEAYETTAKKPASYVALVNEVDDEGSHRLDVLWSDRVNLEGIEWEHNLEHGQARSVSSFEVLGRRSGEVIAGLGWGISRTEGAAPDGHEPYLALSPSALAKQGDPGAWSSEPFRLEPLQQEWDAVPLWKAAMYFPDQLERVFKGAVEGDPEG